MIKSFFPAGKPRKTKKEIIGKAIVVVTSFLVEGKGEREFDKSSATRIVSDWIKLRVILGLPR